jgi:4-hydroxy-tetrahydrodipicolinate synthase
VDWTGAMPAIVTIFDDRGRIDEAAMRQHIERLLDAGASGILAGGCTGEFWALSYEERVELFGLAARAVAGRATLLAGTGAVTVDETVRLTRAAAEAGCDAALILPPYFIRLNDDEIFEHYRAVDAAVGIPIVLYNIPGNALNSLTPGLAARLSELEHVVAIKESSGDWNNFYATLLAVRDSLRVFCGPASLFGVPAMDAGADGFIDCFPNVWLPGGIRLYECALNGERDEALELQAKGRHLTDLFTSDGRSLYPATKAAMNRLGFNGGLPRGPLQPLSAEALQGLYDGLDRLGIA